MFGWLRRRRAYRAMVAQDAKDLIDGFGADEAYNLARHRSTAAFDTVLDSNRPEGHWDNVRREIRRITGRQIGLDTATRMAERDV